MTGWLGVLRLATAGGSVLAVAMIAITVPIVLATRSQASSEAFLWPIPFAAMALVGAFVANRRPSISTGWLFLAAGLLMVSNALAQAYALYALERAVTGRDVAAWLGSWTWMPATVLIALALIVFPNGQAMNRFWRWVVRVGALLIPVTVAAALPILGQPASLILEAAIPWSVPGGEVLSFLAEGPLPAFLPIAFVALAARFIRSRGVERQQMKWFVFGASLVAAATLIMFLLTAFFRADDPISNPLVGAVLGIGMTALPVTAAIAILRYRLYDIDVVINKTLVYGLLAAFITALYVGLVVGVGALIGSRGNLFLSILATAVIAVGFQPARERARRLADRLVYGKRATPYEVLSEFGERLAGSYATDEVLPRLARVVGEGVGATRSRIWLRVGGELRPVGEWPAAGQAGSLVELPPDGLPSFDGEDLAFDVRHQGELLGAITVSMPPREALTPAGEKLLQDLAAHAGLILRNVRLIEELRASRQRIVAAQDQERRRLERNIHDGAQQQLVALSVKARLAGTFIDRDRERAKRTLEEIKLETTEALENLRDLARGIYPPLLADKGLAAALESQARKAPIPVEVLADGVARLPEEVEAGVYFCVLEALQNVAKYAEASRAVVRLGAEDEDFAFEVSDDGRGFDPAVTPSGSGLQNMRDRIEALGGTLEIRSEIGAGTRVTGRLPVP